tara:strand:+ start:8407 stop:8622 length:216 start_codon:yes stop_codon:yes gene_type:complete
MDRYKILQFTVEGDTLSGKWFEGILSEKVSEEYIINYLEDNGWRDVYPHNVNVTFNAYSGLWEFTADGYFD